MSLRKSICRFLYQIVYLETRVTEKCDTYMKLMPVMRVRNRLIGSSSLDYYYLWSSKKREKNCFFKLRKWKVSHTI